MYTQGSKQKWKLEEKAFFWKAMNHYHTFTIHYFCWQKKNNSNSGNCFCFSCNVEKSTNIQRKSYTIISRWINCHI